MQKKKDNLDNLMDRIVRKDYNNELEKILEKKAFAENTKTEEHLDWDDWNVYGERGQ